MTTAAATAALSANLLSVDDLSVGYGHIQALHGVSVSIRPGEIVAILGANGAGKSTLLNAIAGLLPVRGGDIVFEGRSLKGVPAHRRASIGIALVPEGRKIFTPLSVGENLRLGMLASAWFGKERLFAERLEKILETFPALKPRLEVAAGDLSGGQQQMLAIGRALMSNPRLVLLDEPSIGLAPRIVEEVFEVMLELNERDGLTVLIAEQNIAEALSVADRGYVLQVGTVAVHERAETLLHDRSIEEVYLGRRKDLAESIGEAAGGEIRSDG